MKRFCLLTIYCFLLLTGCSNSEKTKKEQLENLEEGSTSDETVERLKSKDGFVQTDKDRREREKLIGDLDSEILTDYPDTLNLIIKRFVQDKTKDKDSKYEFITYYPIITEELEDGNKRAFIDSNQYAVELIILTKKDSTSWFITYDRDFSFKFEFQRE